MEESVDIKKTQYPHTCKHQSSCGQLPSQTSLKLSLGLLLLLQVPLLQRLSRLLPGLDRKDPARHGAGNNESQDHYEYSTANTLQYSYQGCTAPPSRIPCAPDQ